MLTIRKRTKHNECHFCKHKRNVPGNAHIRCADPDPKMDGEAHGIKQGWFFYPMLFDPAWKSKECDHFEPKTTTNED